MPPSLVKFKISSTYDYVGFVFVLLRDKVENTEQHIKIWPTTFYKVTF